MRAICTWIGKACIKVGTALMQMATDSVEPDDDLGEDEPFERNVTREAAQLRVVSLRKKEPPAEPLKGSVKARLAQRRPRW